MNGVSCSFNSPSGSSKLTHLWRPQMDEARRGPCSPRWFGGQFAWSHELLMNILSNAWRLKVIIFHTMSVLDLHEEAARLCASSPSPIAFAGSAYACESSCLDTGLAFSYRTFTSCLNYVYLLKSPMVTAEQHHSGDISLRIPHRLLLMPCDLIDRCS